MANTGYFLVADLLGFGKLVKNSSPTELDTRILAWTDLVDRTATLHGVEHLQLISDTLFAACPSTHEGLKSLLAFSQDLLNKGIEESYPIRGAIVHGEFVFGRLTYGRAVVAGHELEQAQNWIGIACASNLPGIDSCWAVDRVVCYPVPQKGGPMQLHPAVAWSIPPTNRLMKLLGNGGLLREGEAYSWNLAEKANNTILFRAYLNKLRQSVSPPDRFVGMLPADMVEP